MFKAKHLVLILGAAMGFSAGTALALVSKTPPSVNTTVVGAPASTATFNKDGSITIKSSNFKIGVFSTATANSVIKDPSKLKSITGNIVTVQSPKGGFSIISIMLPPVQLKLQQLHCIAAM
ncbi:MAG: hypothetical protein HWD59_15000 [Coxiellaceae bacterium]|nr:MAG: hypothetical protein HWD59_15000 [Coxiellaceae bacterium]